jgi:phosphate transport system permease protein
MAIIASILGIFAFILLEVLPLMTGAEISPRRDTAVPGEALQALVSDEHRTHVVGLGLDGVVRAVRLSDGTPIVEKRILPPRRAEAAGEPTLLRVESPPGSQLITASTNDGRIVLLPVAWGVSFEGQSRQVAPRLSDPLVLEIAAPDQPIDTFAARVDDDGTTTAVAQLADRSLVLVRREMQENLFTGEVAETVERTTATLPFQLSALMLDSAQRSLYGSTNHGELLWWQLDGSELGTPQLASAGTSPITAMSLLIGELALVVGQADGTVSVWFPVRQQDGDGQQRLHRIRDFPAQDAAIRHFAPSTRDRGFLALDGGGGLSLYHSTAHRTLWTGRTPVADPTALFFAPKANGAFVAGAGQVAELEVVNPHPEITLRTLFGKVWYESYPDAEYVWQSSGSGDDFEAKFSLTPLLVGTLKGTFYSLILAIPLAVCGAMYASQFMHPGYRNIVKPTVEIMAALPSVVLGFLAGLWLAPRLEKAFPALILMAAALPMLILLAGAIWHRLARRMPTRIAMGGEALVFVGVLAAGIWACVQASPAFETIAFGGSFQTWLPERMNLTYDQRNAIVVGLAMGFAVIPIIFSVSEDAFSSVPLNLISGSLALGATRWQTVTRVVLPSASPGIFSAIMIGFGRAVGETMIVLMATGNTPILDWSPFNGFRTLSANIAVEIPEAPQFGTLYRVLFLAALLLFLVTFVVNTAAELVRQRLRQRYSQL